jgi:V8-like Glu-specific endopeptidase
MAVRELTPQERVAYPYSAVGVIFAAFPDGAMAHGTAAIVGRNDVLTATHVLYSPEHGGWATGLSFFFGVDYNSVLNQLDSATSSYILRSGTFTWQAQGYPANVFADSSPLLSASESQYDVAVIGLSVPIGDTTGWFGLDPGRNYTQTVTEVGFPSDGTGMMVSDVTVSRNPFYGVYQASTAAMGPGSSGGPLFSNDWYVIGVKSAGSGSSSVWADIDTTASQMVDFIRTDDALLADSQAAPRYAVAANARTVDEGGTASFTITTQNVAPGTRLTYALSGVQAADLVSGVLTGSVTVGANGAAQVGVPIAADHIAEGSETLVLSVNGASASVVILDTSYTTTTLTAQSRASLTTSLAVYRAFHGTGPTAAEFSDMASFLSTSSSGAYANGLAARFLAAGTDVLASAVLSYVGISTSTLGGGAPSVSYSMLHDGLGLVFSVYTGAAGQVVLNLCSLLAGLEGDAVFGAVARAFNSAVADDLSRLVGTLAQAAPGELVDVVGSSVPTDLAPLGY